jgi:hypothetical protein
MNSGTEAAKEAANMVDLDSDPTKLIDIVTDRQTPLITRGALIHFRSHDTSQILCDYSQSRRAELSTECAMGLASNAICGTICAHLQCINYSSIDSVSFKGVEISTTHSQSIC